MSNDKLEVLYTTCSRLTSRIASLSCLLASIATSDIDKKTHVGSLNAVHELASIIYADMCDFEYTLRYATKGRCDRC